MRVWSLSSGSSGNGYLVHQDGCLLLVEAGLTVARVRSEMVRLGFSLPEVAAVLVSHEHSDHWSSAAALARAAGAPVVCTPGTWQAGGAPTRAGHEPLAAGGVLKLGPFTVEAFPLPHDAAEPVGFSVQAGGAALCLATDMGLLPPEVVERAQTADLVVLESNHDVGMVARGPYPTHLKLRILGDRGHLSNEAAGLALARMAEGRPRRFWLAHLSDTNNSPKLALATVREVLRRQGLEAPRVEVALRDRRSLFWDSEAGVVEQLRLF